MSDEQAILTRKQQVFIDEYLKSFNATDAAKRAGYSEKTAYAMGWENLRKPEIKAAIQARLDEIHMSSEEAIKRVADIARSDIGVFFKVADEWMFNPLPEYEILDEREVLDETTIPPQKKVSYRVRHVILDMDKVRDPQYSWMLKSFSNSRKNGYKIELHDQYDAIQDVLKLHGKFVDRHDVTSDGKPLTEIGVKIVDYRTGITETETGSSDDSKTPGTDKNSVDGS